MMLPCTGGPTCSDLRYRNRIDHVDQSSRMLRQQTREPWREASADHHRSLSSSSQTVKGQKIACILGSITDGNDMGARLERSLSGLSMMPGRRGQDHDGGGDPGPFVEPTIGILERFEHSPRSIGVGVMEQQLSAGAELAGNMGASGAQTYDGDRHQRRSGPDTSRQPPSRGGTPPVPRKRKKAASIPAIDSAATTLRNNPTMNPGYRDLETLSGPGDHASAGPSQSVGDAKCSTSFVGLSGRSLDHIHESVFRQ